MPDEEITLKTVLDHMAGMEQRLSERILGIDSRMDGLEGRMDGLAGRVEGMEANLSRQIDGIDQRLDEIEIETLPKRVTALESTVHR